MSNVLTHLPQQSRYVFTVNGEDVGLTDYVRRGDAIYLTHTEITPDRRGDGLGENMVRQILDGLRTETDARVVADCPFVREFMNTNPEYQELETRG
ncbi:MAG: hypothetical protein JWP30_328 [Homoserinimonas sp.]|jgi:predicted GNAT family acetyltransferase|nr:hypothetical protein [Homoserinimonas sp.]